MKRSLLVLLCAASVLVSCRHENETVLPDLSQQVEALLDSMTVDEKIGQLMNATPGIERLGIKPYDWWNEGLHGVGRNVAPRSSRSRSVWRHPSIRSCCGRSAMPLPKRPAPSSMWPSGWATMAAMPA